MNTRNTRSFANFAAVCTSLLLTGALSAQAADAKPAQKPADVTSAHAAGVGAHADAAEPNKLQAYHDKVQHHQDVLPQAPPCQGKQPSQEDRAAQSIGDVHTQLDPMDQLEQDDRDELPTDRSASIDPVPEPIPAAEPMDLSLSIRSVDGGLAVTMERQTDGPAEQLWIGGILGGLDPYTVRYSADLPPMLGRSTVLAAALVTQGQLDQSITAEVRHQGFDWLGFYVQGVAFTLEGAQATRVLPAEFGQGGDR